LTNTNLWHRLSVCGTSNDSVRLPIWALRPGPLLGPQKVGPLRPFNPRPLLLFSIAGGELRTIRLPAELGAIRPRFASAWFLFGQIVKNEQIREGYPNAWNAAAELAGWLQAFKEPPENPSDDTWSVDQHFLDIFLDKGLLGKLDSALDIDISALTIYLVEEKRGYSIPTLLRNIENVLPTQTRGLLSSFVYENMQEAGACLAFERFTGCGYHMARAVEDVARRYYSLITGRSTEYIDSHGVLRYRMLGQIAEELHDVLNKYPKGTEPELLSLIVPTLRQFCRIYRHRLSHADPELETLEPDDAEIAFGHAVAAISTIFEDVRRGGSHFYH
jgi:hypothetical protein